MNETEKQIAELEAKIAALKAPPTTPVVRLDLGCGANKKKAEGNEAPWLGVDKQHFDGVDVVFDLVKERWPWNDASVDEVHCSHTLEHFTWPERIYFFNELYRVMKKGAKAQIIVPHWCSARYYGDPTHKEPFSEWGWFYLDAEWRKKQAPHTDAANVPGMYACDFTTTYGYSTNPSLSGRNPEFLQFATMFYKEAAMDMAATLVKK